MSRRDVVHDEELRRIEVAANTAYVQATVTLDWLSLLRKSVEDALERGFWTEDLRRMRLGHAEAKHALRKALAELEAAKADLDSL